MYPTLWSPRAIIKMAFLHLSVREHTVGITYVYIYDIHDMYRQIYMYMCMHKEACAVTPCKYVA